ncbi:MAG: hypothetical protein ABSD61_00280 [Terracidiphilus sp.]|jgi:hypothetical protein
MSSNPAPILPAATPENSIAETMQHQRALIQVLARIAKSLEAIQIELAAKKSH